MMRDSVTPRRGGVRGDWSENASRRVRRWEERVRPGPNAFLSSPTESPQEDLRETHRFFIGLIKTMETRWNRGGGSIGRPPSLFCIVLGKEPFPFKYLLYPRWSQGSRRDHLTLSLAERDA